MNKAIGILSVIAAVVVVLCIITWNYNRTMVMPSNTDNIKTSQSAKDVQGTSSDETQESSEGVKEEPAATKAPVSDAPVKEFNLTAKQAQTEIAEGITLTTWTYDGTVPGTEIRVTEGDFVRVNVTNTLEVPITIHWHGYPVKSAMDGIPGYTQDAILPGQTFTYEFKADHVGTYWYHSHQESSKQVDMGLYGALIVEPKEEEQIDQDFTLILDEWMENSDAEMSMSMSSNDTEASSMAGMEGMDSKNSTDNKDNTDSMSGMEGMGEASDSTVATEETGSTDLELQEEQMMKELYNIYTVNGKSGDLIQPLNVSEGDIVKLRFINAGYRTHGIHIPGQIIRVASTDGQAIQGAGELQDEIIEIAPGERYDVVFTVNTQDDFYIDFHDDNLYNDQMKIPVRVIGGSGTVIQEDKDINLPVFDLLSYGAYSTGKFSLGQSYDVEQYIELNTDTKDGTLKYTINGETFDELQPITVTTGNLVKITYENKSQVDHPMHLHGHFFQVLSKNDEVYTGAPIMKDTLLIKPGEKYVIAFKADNPGNWVYHCHELHHAAGGMMQKIVYSDYTSNYTPDPGNDYNNPE